MFASVNESIYIEAKIAVFYGLNVECTRSNGNAHCMLNAFNIPMSSLPCVYSNAVKWTVAHISYVYVYGKIKGGANTWVTLQMWFVLFHFLHSYHTTRCWFFSIPHCYAHLFATFVRIFSLSLSLTLVYIAMCDNSAEKWTYADARAHTRACVYVSLLLCARMFVHINTFAFLYALILSIKVNKMKRVLK